MALSRPSKSQRDEWAELLGDKHRNKRRWLFRLLVIPPLAVILAVPFVLLSGAGYIGGCPTAKDATAFWAKPAAQVEEGEREKQIRLALRCYEFEGKDRLEIMKQFGEWTSVKEYPATIEANGGAYLVWSNGSDTPGIGVVFQDTKGAAMKAERYDPAEVSSSESSGASSGSEPSATDEG